MKLFDKIKNNEVYIIAEMSANHAGKIENAIKIIEGAARAGADCVKTQTYTADSLTIDCDDEAYRIKGGLWDGYNYYKLYQEAATPLEWQAILKKKCEEVGVDFLSTPFDKAGVDFLESLDVEFYKIASYELTDIPFIRYVASKRKPIVMSCGLGSEEEIREALTVCKEQGNEDVVLLKCCSQYPAVLENMNLLSIPLMKEKFGKNIGLSDHSFGSLAPIIAVSLGACVIEKHVKIDNGDESVDSGFSMTMEDFTQMVKDVRETKTTLGVASLERTEYDIKNLSGRRSLVACKDIKAGDIFTSENIKSVRPAIGIEPKYCDIIIGTQAKKDYAFGAPIEMCEVDKLHKK